MNPPTTNRRDFLKTTSNGFGYLAFAALAQQQALRAESSLVAKNPHFAARAKRRPTWTSWITNPNSSRTVARAPHLRLDVTGRRS
jgi:hypothetical protein